MSAVALFTHRRPQDTHDAVLLLVEIARRRRITLRLHLRRGRQASDRGRRRSSRSSTTRATTSSSASRSAATARSSPPCAATPAPASRSSASTTARSASWPRSTRTASQDDFDRAFSGEFDTIQLPTVSVGRPQGTWNALNDISVHRKAGLRVADLAYALAGEEIGRVRCDGLVVATPQGSTGYNLANGGPVLAWGVEGYVVSFIAPHSLTARALVVAPDRRADDQQRLPRGTGRGPRRRPADARALTRRGHPRRVRSHPRHARPAPGRLVLPPPARALRPPVVLAHSSQLCAESCNFCGREHLIRRDPLVDPSMCSTNCASRTSC